MFNPSLRKFTLCRTYSCNFCFMEREDYAQDGNSTRTGKQNWITSDFSITQAFREKNTALLHVDRGGSIINFRCPSLCGSI